MISPEDPKAKSQIDVIIWKPNPYPAIFECENFAIVPKRSVFGLIEIKSSNYSKSIQNIENSIKSYSNMMTEGLSYSKGVGVVCLYTGNKIEQEKLTSNKPYFILFTKKGDSDIEPNPKGIISFIQYLINLEYDLMRVDLLKKPTNNLINSLD